MTTETTVRNSRPTAASQHDQSTRPMTEFRNPPGRCRYCLSGMPAPCQRVNQHGVRTRALVTRMDAPLGRAVGNALEVEEAVAALRGEGPPDLVEVTFALARPMLELAGL